MPSRQTRITALAGWMLLIAAAWATDASAAPLRNISQSAGIRSSSKLDGGTAPENAIDYFMMTSWTPAGSKEEWIEMNFAEPQVLRQVVFRWEFSIPCQWRLELSRDRAGDNWKEIAGGERFGRLTDVKLNGDEAVRLRLVCSASTQMACSIADLQVWADPMGPRTAGGQPADAAEVQPPQPEPAAPTIETKSEPQPTAPEKPGKVETIESESIPDFADEMPADEPIQPAAAAAPAFQPIRIAQPDPKPRVIAKAAPVVATAPAATLSTAKPKPRPIPAPLTVSPAAKTPTPPVPSNLITLINDFDERAGVRAIGDMPRAEGQEGCAVTGRVTEEGNGHKGTGRSFHVNFVVAPEETVRVTNNLRSPAPASWSEINFWFRGEWRGKWPLEVMLADPAGREALVSIPGTERGSRLWRHVIIPAQSIKRIHPDQIKTITIRFTERHQTGNIYIDDFFFRGGDMDVSGPRPRTAGTPFTQDGDGIPAVQPAQTVDPSKNSTFPPNKPRDDWDEWESSPGAQEAPQTESPTGGDSRNTLPPGSIEIHPVPPARSGPLAEVRPFTAAPADRQSIHDMMTKSYRADPKTSEKMTDDEFLDLVERRAFLYFWYGINPENGITLDGAKNQTVDDDWDWNSIAAVGFGLTAICIGAERGWITKEMAYERCRLTLDAYLNRIPNSHGFYYHFTNRKGVNDRNTELSSIDSALMFFGMLFAGEYFKGTEVEKMARKIYDRVDWRWMHNNKKFASMGGDGKAMFIEAYWDRHCEGQMLSILELGHPQNMPTNLWTDMPDDFSDYQGYRTLRQGPLFTFQFPACWIDFRDRNDGVVNFWENGVIATLANRHYAVEKSPERKGYGPNSWGFTAGDHPDGYHPFASPPSAPGENGTITINAAGGSVMFTPHFSIQALRWMYDNLHDKVWGKYGFTDGYNLDRDWACGRVIGIGTGPMLLSIENHRTGFVWKTFMQNDYIQRGMERAGFKDEPRRNANVRPLDLSGYWKWNKGDNKKWSSPDLDDSKWQEMYAPDKWEMQLTKDGDRAMAEYDGFAWYRLRFTVPERTWETWKGQDLYVHFGAIDDADEVFLNGEKIGSTGSMDGTGESQWEKFRKYKIPSKLVRVGAENVIAVRVLDGGGGGGIWMYPLEFGPYLPLDFKPKKVN